MIISITFTLMCVTGVRTAYISHHSLWQDEPNAWLLATSHSLEPVNGVSAGYTASSPVLRTENMLSFALRQLTRVRNVFICFELSKWRCGIPMVLDLVERLASLLCVRPCNCSRFPYLFALPRFLNVYKCYRMPKK